MSYKTLENAALKANILLDDFFSDTKIDLCDVSKWKASGVAPTYLAAMLFVYIKAELVYRKINRVQIEVFFKRATAAGLEVHLNKVTIFAFGPCGQEFEVSNEEQRLVRYVV
jgi:hypothetical protein